jgi:ribokinase
MDGTILFAGDGNIDLQFTGLASLPLTDKEVMCSEFAATVGGSTTICAVAYTTLGGRAEFCGLFGSDDNGRLMERLLREAGVGLSLLRVTDESATGVTANLVYESTRTQITFPGTLSIVDETDTIIREIHRFRHIHLAGIFPLARFLPRIVEVLRAAREAGVTSSITTQWDPSQEWKQLDEWLPLLTWLFVNEEEARSITRRTSIEDAYRDLAGRTASPLITMGAAGAYAGGRIIPGVKVRVRDTTGAGDSFAAGFLYAVEGRGMRFDEAVRYACAAGALSCTYTGGVSAELKDERVRALLTSS